MFGLGEDKKKAGEFFFDLEIEGKDAAGRRKMINDTISRMQEIKVLLRAGLDESEFQKVGTLLMGYAALQKVLGALQV